MNTENESYKAFDAISLLQKSGVIPKYLEVIRVSKTKEPLEIVLKEIAPIQCIEVKFVF